jgi:eukaryotic-like serine/threonine-protein kinase
MNGPGQATLLNAAPSPSPGGDPLVGTTIAGKYDLVRLIGQGGMGAVYEGRNTSTFKRCAVKVLLSPELAQNSQIVRRFFREARASSVIESDHIVQVYDSGTDPQSGLPYMVMELLNGQDLEGTLRHFGALQPLAAAKLVLQAALGLAKAHEQSIVHRDIKPANLYLTRRESGELVLKILDFGIAKVRMEKFSETSSGVTREGSMLGTPLYMSPEQARGAAAIDVRSDVWSLGVVLYELLCGSLPYTDASSLGELMVSIITADIPLLQDKAPWVPPELAEICHRAMSRDINRRFAHAGELAAALTAIVPEGARMTADMLIGITPEQRTVVAPRLQLTGDGMLRAITRTGLTLTQSPARRTAAQRTGIGLGISFLVIAAAAGGVFAWNHRKPASESLQAPVASATSVSEAITVGPTIKRFDLTVVAPAEVEIAVDGERRAIVGGKVELYGAPGSTRKIELRVGEQFEEHLVAITDGGLLPWKLEFSKGSAAPAAPGAARPGGPVRAGAPGKPAAAAADTPAAPAKPAARKVQVETGMDEFN